MPPARSFVRRGRSRAPRRQTTWVGPADQGFVNVGSGASVIIGSFDPTAVSLLKTTLARTRGEVAFGPQAFTVDLEIVGAYGVAVVSDQAFAAGAASIPGPWNNPGWDGWLVWRSFHYVLEVTGTPVELFKGFDAHEVDSKGMRKVSDNETVVLMAESQATAFQISMALRLLFILS